jgi:hypothetical protein
LKKHNPWFDEGCLELLNQREQAKLQWLQDPSEVNGDNLNNIKVKPAGISGIRKREYLKDRIDELATNSKNKNVRDLYRGIIELMKGYQPRSNLEKDENGDLLADSHNILNWLKNYFSELLKVRVHRVSDIRQVVILLSR